MLLPIHIYFLSLSGLTHPLYLYNFQTGNAISEIAVLIFLLAAL